MSPRISDIGIGTRSVVLRPLRWVAQAARSALTTFTCARNRPKDIVEPRGAPRPCDIGHPTDFAHVLTLGPGPRCTSESDHPASTPTLIDQMSGTESDEPDDGPPSWVPPPTPDQCISEVEKAFAFVFAQYPAIPPKPLVSHKHFVHPLPSVPPMSLPSVSPGVAERVRDFEALIGRKSAGLQ